MLALLGFRFDVDALSIAMGGVYRADRCPRECRRCRPPLETVLNYELEPTGRPLPGG